MQLAVFNDQRPCSGGALTPELRCTNHPVVVLRIIQDGIVLDVQPIIQNDRKYITLNLNPTVAELQRPIPYPAQKGKSNRFYHPWQPV